MLYRNLNKLLLFPIVLKKVGKKTNIHLVDIHISVLHILYFAPRPCSTQAVVRELADRHHSRNWSKTFAYLTFCQQHSLACVDEAGLWRITPYGRHLLEQIEAQLKKERVKNYFSA